MLSYRKFFLFFFVHLPLYLLAIAIGRLLGWGIGLVGILVILVSIRLIQDALKRKSKSKSNECEEDVSLSKPLSPNPWMNN